MKAYLVFHSEKDQLEYYKKFTPYVTANVCWDGSELGVMAVP